jgi:hypothetical protein
MKNNVLLTTTIVVFCILISTIANADIFVDNLKPIYKKCNNVSNSKQSVRYSSKPKDHAYITWSWKEFPSGNCHWALSSPLNIDAYTGGYMVIEVVEKKNDGSNSPEVLLVDGDDNRTPLVKIFDYEVSEGFKIPLTEFGLDNIDISNLKQIQFDSPWDHSHGEIKIKSISFKR